MQKKTHSLLFVTGSLERGGCELHLLRLLPKLKEQNFEIELFVFGPRGSLAKEFKKQGVKICHRQLGRLAYAPLKILKAVNLFFNMLHLAFYLLIKRPNLVHFFLPLPYLLGAPVAICMRVRYKLMSRRSLNVYHKKFPAIAIKFEKYLHGYMQKILGNSKKVVEQLINEEQVSKQQTHLIYNGIDIKQALTQDAKTNMRQSLSISPSALVLTCVANLIDYKGHFDLIAAIVAIRSQLDNLTQKDWQLLLAGRDGGMGAALKAAVHEANLQEHVVFLKERTDVFNLFSVSDIGLLCSHHEGFSNAILEGMSAGIPMIVTDVGGNPEAVSHGKTGLVVPAQDPNKIASAIMDLATQPQYRHSMGEAARQRVVQYFNLDICVNEYVKMYSTLLKTSEPYILEENSRLSPKV